MKKNRSYTRFAVIFAFAFIVFGINYGWKQFDQSTSIGYRNGIEQGIPSRQWSNGSADNTLVGIDSDIEAVRFVRDTSLVDYNNINFIRWDVAKASENVVRQYEKPFTMMIYMNGSDLESENGAATDDLIEMLDSGVNTENVNILLFTGGTNRWQNNLIPSNNCVIWQINHGYIEQVAGVGLVNMGNPGTLSSFIDFSMQNYPAEKYGLILWDHGGGSIAGYGHDEKFEDSNLTLLDMDYAFLQSGLSDNKLEFIGFDSCLMATVEMAVVASDYANYLTASEDLEPGEGWDYGFFAEFNKNPFMDGAMLGKTVVDYFMNFYNDDAEVDLTMSVTDLSEVSKVMGAMGVLMDKCMENMSADKTASFKTFARRRYGTKTFGEGSPRDNDCDMVDIGDMAKKLADIYPIESQRVIDALCDSVVYNRHNSDVDLMGLSAYYIYGGKDAAKYSLSTYKALYMNGLYTDYLHDFAGMLYGKNVTRSKRGTLGDSSNAGEENAITQTDDILSVDYTVWVPVEGKTDLYMMTGIRKNIDIHNSQQDENILWPEIKGKPVCLYEINKTDKHSLYVIPAVLNGHDCDIVVSISERHPEGLILGARQEDGFIIQKGYDQLKDGDKLAFYYQTRTGGNSENSGIEIEWHKGEEITVKNELELNWMKTIGDGILYSFHVTDIYQNEYYTELLPIK